MFSFTENYSRLVLGNVGPLFKIIEGKMRPKLAIFF